MTLKKLLKKQRLQKLHKILRMTKTVNKIPTRESNCLRSIMESKIKLEMVP
jgi:hypothetical protein